MVAGFNGKAGSIITENEVHLSEKKEKDFGKLVAFGTWYNNKSGSCLLCLRYAGMALLTLNRKDLEF